MTREITLRQYFKAAAQEPRKGKGVALLTAGALLLLVSLAMSAEFGALSLGCGSFFAVPGILLALWGGGRLAREHSRYRRQLRATAAGPADEEVEAWLMQSFARVKDRALQALGLPEKVLKSDLLTIVAPVLWSIEGIDSGDLVFRTGRDGCARFGVYSLTIIALTQERLGVFSCVYNFIRDTTGNEKTCEYLYRDIVSVATSEVASPLLLPSGEELSTVQEFRVSVSSGEAIRITVDAPKIHRLTGVDALPASGAEQAVRTIRTMLRRETA